MSQVEVETICIAWAMERLRHERCDLARVEESYHIIHRNSRSLRVSDIVMMLRAIIPHLSIYRRDHLISVRRHVEFSGTSPDETNARVTDLVPFDPTQHILYVPGRSHLDLLTRGTFLLDAMVRKGRGGVVLWWDFLPSDNV
jgi:hypothetical protein